MLNRESKFKDLYAMLKDNILSNRYGIENPIPSVRALMRKSGFSSTTVRRALGALERDGLISCCRGSGSFVTPAAVSRKIGLVVPGVAYSEFFPPIVSEISRLAQERNYTLLFADMTAGSSEVRARKAKRFARELVREKAAGVIYQPLEFLDDADSVNREIVSVFDESHIPVELLDYDIVSPPERSQHDVIGINNVDAGYRLACHLMDQGARKIHFLMRPNWAPSVRNRLRGAISALNSGGGVNRCKYSVLIAEPDNTAALRRHLRHGKPDAFICGNDTAAAVFKQSLEKVGLSVPQDLLLAAFDDVKIAALLTPPLTTIHQPCAEIGRVAFERLLRRVAEPDLPTEEIFLSAPLIVRQSTMFPSAKAKASKTKTKER